MPAITTGPPQKKLKGVSFSKYYGDCQTLKLWYKITVGELFSRDIFHCLRRQKQA